MNKTIWTLAALVLCTGTLLTTIFLTGHQFAISPASQVATVTGAGSGLVGHWTFDDNANDSAGSNNGTLIGGPSYVDGKIGKAVIFDGVNDSVNMGNVLSFERTDPFSFTAWVKRNQSGSADQIITKMTNSSGFTGYMLSFTNTDAIIFYIRHNVDNVAAVGTTGAFSDVNRWYHVSATYDGSSSVSGMKIYVDGNLVPIGTITNTLSGTIVNTQPLQLAIRGTTVNSTSNPLNGFLDDVRIYNRTLSASEVAEIYTYTGSSGSATVPPPVAPNPINGICGLIQDTCTAGPLSSPSQSSTQYLWSCLGSNGGANASCSLDKPVVSGGGDSAFGTCSDISVIVSPVTFNWNFDTSNGVPQCGKFANGDWWVSPAVGQSSVRVNSVTLQGGGNVFVDENPQIEAIGFLTKNYGNQNTSQNIVPKLPVQFSYDTSLVAVAERDEAKQGACGTSAILSSCVGAYNVLTILKDVPPGNGGDILRPSIDETTKKLFSFSDFDLTRLPARDHLVGTSAAGIEDIRKRWSHSTEIFSITSTENKSFSEGGRAFRASYLVDDYSAGVSARWNTDLAILFSDDNTLAEKKPALAAMLVYGKDLYDAVFDGSTRKRGWGGGAGQGLNKYPPAVFFAALAKDSFYGNILRNNTLDMLDNDLAAPQELEQINIGYNGPIWGDSQTSALRNTGVGSDLNRYWGTLSLAKCFDGATGTCNLSGGRRTSQDPHGYIDGPENLSGTAYFALTVGPAKAFLATMSLIPQMCSIVNYPAITEYVDRMVEKGVLSQPDPCAPPDTREPATCDAYRKRGCNYYGLNNTGTATWGPNPSNPSMCILDPDLAYFNSPTDFACKPGKTCGRFPAMHGSKFRLVYTTAQFESDWNIIRAAGSGLCALGTKSGATTPPVSTPPPSTPIPTPTVPTPITPAPIFGSCGAVNNACAAGTLNDLADTATQYLWQCIGASGGSSAQCSMEKETTETPTTETPTPPTPNPATPAQTTLINGSCSGGLNECFTGTFQDQTDTPSNYLWSCVGVNGGITAQCSMGVASLVPPSYQTEFIGTGNVSMSLLGNNPSYIQKGASFIDPGVVVQGSRDAIFKVKAKVNGKDVGTINDISVSNLPMGEHTIAYTMTDSDGYTVTAERKLIINRTGSYEKPTVTTTSVNPATATATNSPKYTFTKSLRLGQRGEEVRQLQKFLNAKGFIVATTGAGSPGNETTYFGPATVRAVAKFQEAYATEILTPGGLTRGSGIFGPRTIKKINSL